MDVDLPSLRRTILRPVVQRVYPRSKRKYRGDSLESRVPTARTIFTENADTRID